MSERDNSQGVRNRYRDSISFYSISLPTHSPLSYFSTTSPRISRTLSTLPERLTSTSSFATSGVSLLVHCQRKRGIVVDRTAREK